MSICKSLLKVSRTTLLLATSVVSPLFSQQAEQGTPPQLIVDAPILMDADVVGQAVFPVKIQGHAASVVLNLQYPGTLALSTAALSKIGVTLTDTTRLDTLTLGPIVEYHLPVRLIELTSEIASNPSGLPPVVGVVGLQFAKHYDVLYDLPARRVKLYAVSAHHVRGRTLWLPPGFQLDDCGPLLPVPEGLQYPPFTGMPLRLDGYPVTGVLEMGTYFPKMNLVAAKAMGLTQHSPIVHPLPPDFAGTQDLFGNPVRWQADPLHLTFGTHTFWTGPVQIFPKLGVDDSLPPRTPVMLMSLRNLWHVALFNSQSSQRVCLSRRD